mgnify:CR=1 FL=1
MKDGGASAERNALAAAHAVLGKERKGMKRLTSILLALLMLVGMALAEETPDAALLRPGPFHRRIPEELPDL